MTNLNPSLLSILFILSSYFLYFHNTQPLHACDFQRSLDMPELIFLTLKLEFPKLNFGIIASIKIKP